MSKITDFYNRHKNIVLTLMVAVYFVIILPLMYYFKIPCVFRHFLGLYCPGCGMTRAILSVIHFDFISAFYYNPLVIALPYVAVYILFDLKSKVHKYILVAIGILFLLNWVIRLAVPSLQVV